MGHLAGLEGELTFNDHCNHDSNSAMFSDIMQSLQNSFNMNGDIKSENTRNTTNSHKTDIKESKIKIEEKKIMELLKCKES